MTSSRDLRPTRAIIDLEKIRENFRTMRGLQSAGAFICPMVKANAYGHGDVEVSRALREAGTPHLGVALIEEGQRLRSAGDRGSILVFTVFTDDDSAGAMLDSELTPVAGDWSQLEALERVLNKSLGRKVPLHLEFNTGMNRLGFSPQEAPKLRAWLAARPSISLQGVCTHLLRGEDIGATESESRSQLESFNHVLAAFRGLEFSAHVFNSGAAAAVAKRGVAGGGLASEFQPIGARPGIAIYGAEPSGQSELHLGLRPALTWRSKLISVHRLAKGERVSYSATWRAARPSWIGVVPAGYADGYFRALSNRADVLYRGQRAPIAGMVCMDYFMIDLTDAGGGSAGDPRPGEDVVLIGRQGANEIRGEELAERAGTISYEIFTNVSARVPREYTGRRGSEGQ